MFSRRKLFQLAGLSTAAAVTVRVLPAAAAPTLNWTAEELALLESTGRPVVTLGGALAAQREINRRRSELIRLCELSHGTFIK